MKKILRVSPTPPKHWVGDGFHVHGLFDYQKGAEDRSPFLLLDYAAPMQFGPNFSGRRRGVGAHPHRGFETVTIVFDGEVEHRDSAGHGGIIGPGDVQWMTAGAGVLHEEFHSFAYGKRGGPFQMVQLWVNLPAKAKLTAPSYQAILSSDIPTVMESGVQSVADSTQTSTAASNGESAGEPGMQPGVRIRVIAGQYAGISGPARTASPMSVLDIKLAAGSQMNLDLTDGWTSIVVGLDGAVTLDDRATVQSAEWAELSRIGRGMVVKSIVDSHILVLTGQPLNEPVVGYGPFVMNDQAGIIKAVSDFQSGRFGSLV